MAKKQDYENRVFGCWLGKCIGGNIGAPYEGMKQRMHLTYSPAFLENMLPNDDLDLQILWLDLLEEKGGYASAADYAEAFCARCDYAPGEYAFFKKNYRKGIMPPLSGTFNNEYFNEGMGAPIRSELWACLLPNNPAAAAEFAARDAAIDHRTGGESAHGEMFLAALESICFGGGKLRDAVAGALEHIPADCKLHAAITDVTHWCDEYNVIDRVLDCIIRDYGHSESAMVHQNISIIVAALLLHPNSFTDAVMAAVNCGFDTDCTGATVGAVMGIVYGGARIGEICGVHDAEYKLGIRSPRTDYSVSALTRSVCVMAARWADEMPVARGIAVVQEGCPAIGFGETIELRLRLQPDVPVFGAEIELRIEAPAVLGKTHFTADLTSETVLRTEVGIPAQMSRMPEGMRGEVLVNGISVGHFGLSGKRRWQVYGPFWKNNVSVPPLAAGESYWKYIPGDGDAFMDTLRFFHISALPDETPDGATIPTQETRCRPVTVDTAEDIVRVSECTGFCGNSAYLFESAFWVEEARTVGLQIGRNTPIRVWLDGELLTDKEGNEMFYHETVHKLHVPLTRGEHRLTFRVVKNNEDTRFSYEFLSDGVCSDHVMFPIVNTAIGQNKKGKETKS